MWLFPAELLQGFGEHGRPGGVRGAGRPTTPSQPGRAALTRPSQRDAGGRCFSDMLVSGTSVFSRFSVMSTSSFLNKNVGSGDSFRQRDRKGTSSGSCRRHRLRAARARACPAGGDLVRARGLTPSPSSQRHSVVPLPGRRGGAARPSPLASATRVVRRPRPRRPPRRPGSGLRRRPRATGLAPASASMGPVPPGHLVQLLWEGSPGHSARPCHPSLRVSPSSPCVTLSPGGHGLGTRDPAAALGSRMPDAPAALSEHAQNAKPAAGAGAHRGLIQVPTWLRGGLPGDPAPSRRGVCVAGRPACVTTWLRGLSEKVFPGRTMYPICPLPFLYKTLCDRGKNPRSWHHDSYDC